MFFRNDCSSQQCVATLFSRHPHDDGDAMPTCAHDEHTQQHVTCWSCVEDVVGKLWIGKAQSRKALREDRVGLDDIRRKTAHRVPEEPNSDRPPSRRLRSA